MSFKRSMAVAAFVAVGLAGCDSNGEVTGVVIADLEGSWDASTLTFSPTDPDSEASPIPFISLGGDLVVNIEANGDFAGILTVPGALTPSQQAEDVPVSGSMSITQVGDDDVIVVNFDATTEGIFDQFGLPFEDFDGPFTLSGNQLTITNETTFDFDLGGPGAEEPALMTMILARTST